MPGVPDPGHPFVLVALDLAPADTATLDADRVRAIITEEGGPTSHTAILAKSLGHPGGGHLPRRHRPSPRARRSWSTGPRGPWPSPPTRPPSRRRSTPSRPSWPPSRSVSGPGRTSDGPPGAAAGQHRRRQGPGPAAAADSEGVGLFRTEFLFLDRPNAPTLEEQQAVYQRVFDAFAGRKVVVRTLDAGADKPLEFVTVPDEPNPALGVRGLRTSRRHPELLEEQLTAVAGRRRPARPRSG
jgi:phosphotransferase system enzyme I (PtsI)